MKSTTINDLTRHSANKFILTYRKLFIEGNKSDKFQECIQELLFSYYVLKTWKKYKIDCIKRIWSLGTLKKFQSPNFYKMKKSEKKEQERN